MEKSSSHQKFFGIFLIVSSLVAVFVLWCSEPLFEETSSTSHKQSKKLKVESKLQKIWEKDIKEMVKEDLFNKEIFSIKKVRLFLLDENLHRHFKKLHAPFKLNNDGKNLLEVSFMSHHSENENTDKLVIQYNLTDKDSRNMFWEHSRTITLDPDILKSE